MSPTENDKKIEAAKRRLAARLTAIRTKAVGILASGEDREREEALQRIKKNISK